MHQAYKAIADLPRVDEAIRALLADHTEDNAVFLVQEIIKSQGVEVVQRTFHFDDKSQRHIPMLILAFEPVPVGSPNDAKGWADRDALAERLK